MMMSCNNGYSACLHVHSYNPTAHVRPCSSGRKSPCACLGLFDAALGHVLEGHLSLCRGLRSIIAASSWHLPAMSRA